MNLLVFLGTYCKSIEAFDEDIVPFIHEKCLNELKKKVLSNAIVGYSVFENTKKDELEVLYFVNFGNKFTMLRVMSTSGTSRLHKNKKKYFKILKPYKELESILNEIAVFIKKNCDDGKIPKVYFTINDDVTGFSNERDYYGKVDDVKKKILKKLDDLFADERFEVNFYNYNLQKYAYKQIILSKKKSCKTEMIKAEDDFTKLYKLADTVVIFNVKGRNTVFFLDRNLQLNIARIVEQFIKMIRDKQYCGFGSHSEYINEFISIFFKKLGELSSDKIKVQIWNFSKTYKYILSFILSYEETLKKIKIYILRSVESITDNFPDGFPVDLRDRINFCSSSEQITKIILPEIKHKIKKSKTKYNDDIISLFSFFLKYICKDTYFFNNITKRSNIRRNKKFVKNLISLMSFDLNKYLDIWVRDIAIYSHQRSSYRDNIEYERILKHLEVSSIKDKNRLEKPMPYYVFGHLCDKTIYDSSEFKKK